MMIAAISDRARRAQQARLDLDSALEETLCFGRGPHDETNRLRTRQDWLDAWGQWRDVVLPKFVRVMPGRRPAACYLTGEIPARPLLAPPPLSCDWFRLYVPAADGSGEWLYDYPEPYQREEPWYLVDVGAITHDELRRYRPIDRRTFRTLYPFEAAQGRGVLPCN